MVRAESSAPAGTATNILNIAEELVQRRGFNGFSYADVAAELGITKASLHYHFAGKAELGESLIRRYTERFIERLDRIADRPATSAQKLLEYCNIYRTVLTENRMCLCGVLAAEYETLPRAMCDAVRRFFDLNEAWLSRLLDDGRRNKELQFVGVPEDAARSIVSCLEGSMLVSRAYGNTTVLDSVIDRIGDDYGVGLDSPSKRPMSTAKGGST
jgi:TetR/AcrR family transcriptional regulator, transcriptional repressor for nem operon